MSATAYRHFLRTNSAWHAKRKAVFKRDGYACALCGATDRPLHAHHWHYRAPWGEEELDALVSVCSADHSALHTTPHSAWVTW